MPRWRIWNGPMPTTSIRAAVATGSTLKTMLQVKSSGNFWVVGWGFSMAGAAVAAGVEWELLTTGAIPATSLTAHVAAGITPLDEQAVNGNVAPANRFTLGTSDTGYTAGAEGSIVATRTLDAVFRTPTEVYERVFSKPRLVLAAEYLRIRQLAGSTVNALCWVDVEC